MRKLIPFLLLCVLLSGCTRTTNTKDKASNKDSNVSYCGEDNESASCGIGSMDMSAYEGFTDKNNVFVKSDMKEAIAMFEEKKSGILYFGFPACPWCVEALPIMDEVAKTNKKTIHYVETRDEKKKLLYTQEQKKTLIPYAKEFLEKKDGEYQLYVPLVLVVKDGKAIYGHTGTVDDHDAHKRKMTTKEKAELKKIYEEMFS